MAYPNRLLALALQNIKKSVEGLEQINYELKDLNKNLENITVMLESIRDCLNGDYIIP